MVKNPPTMQKNTEDAGDPGLMPGSGGSLEEEMSTHSSILAWENPMEGGARRARVHGIAESDMIKATEHAHKKLISSPPYDLSKHLETLTYSESWHSCVSR